MAARGRAADYSPGRLDARTGEARAFLGGCRHLRNMTTRGLACQFNLRDETASHLIKYEKARRGEG